MFTPPTLSDRLTVVRACTSSESLAAVYHHNIPLAAPHELSDAHIEEEVTRSQVREVIAASTLCPAALSRAMASDPSRRVRVTVAATTSEGSLLNRLADDRDSVVREAVAGNIACALYLLKVLAVHDEDPLVRYAAERTLNGTPLAPVPVSQDPQRATVCTVRPARQNAGGVRPRSRRESFLPTSGGLRVSLRPSPSFGAPLLRAATAAHPELGKPLTGGSVMVTSPGRPPMVLTA